MKRSGQIVAAGLVALSLSGCALASLSPAKPPRTYDLMAPSHYGSQNVRQRDWQLVIKEPSAVRAVGTDRILIRPAPSEIAYFSNAVWSDRLTRLLQTRMVEGFQSSGRFRAVSNGREQVDSDLEMSTEIRAFNVDASNGHVTASVNLFAKLIEQRYNKIIASKGFVEQISVSSDNVGAGVDALNQAFAALLPRMASWAARAPYQPRQRISYLRKDDRSQSAREEKTGAKPVPAVPKPNLPGNGTDLLSKKPE